jgi:hypothetical protein
MREEPVTVADDEAAPGDFGRVIEIMLEKPEFQQAWLELRDVGLESAAAVQRVWDMLTQSARHGRLFADVTNTLVQAAGDWACSIDWAAVDEAARPGMHHKASDAAFDDAAFSRFQEAVAQQISTIAACYFLFGAVVGMMSAATRERADPP